MDGLPDHGVACYANALTFDSIALGEYHPVTTYPFLVVGANSIAMYVIVHVATDYMFRAFRIHLGRAVIDHIPTPFQTITLGAATLAVFWHIPLRMYRRRVLIRI